MENNNHKKRKVMLIAAFAVAVIALAGVGYAAISGLGYTGTTVNSNNTAEGKYIVVSQSGTGAYTGVFNATEGNEVKFDTYTDNGYKTTTLYSLADSTDLGTISGTHYYGAKIGETLTFAITGDTTSVYNVSAKTIGALNGTGTDGWTYILKISGPSDDKYIVSSGNSINGTITGLVASTEVTAELYIASSTLFQNITEPAPLVITEGDVPNYGEPTAKTSPISEHKLFSAISVVFTFEAAQDA